MAKLTHKQGGTFRLSCQWKTAGVPQDITGDTITCRLENAKYGYNLLVNVEYEATGEFELLATAAMTALWKLGTYNADIKRVTPSGDVYPSETFVIEIIPKVT